MRFLTLICLLLMAAAMVAQTTKTPVRRYFNPPPAPAQAPRPFSEAVLAGDTLYVAGHIGLDAKTGKPPADVEQEIRNLLDSFKATLALAGMNMDDLVSVQVFCSDVTLYSRFNAAYRTYFAKEFPARAFIGSGPLLFNAHFEMLGVAVKR